METIGFLVHDIYNAIIKETKIQPTMVTVSGGGARDPLLQFISDLLQITIGHTTLKDRTALGVYKLLKYSHKNIDQKDSIECDKVFTPKMNTENRKVKLENWKEAINKIL